MQWNFSQFYMLHNIKASLQFLQFVLPWTYWATKVKLRIQLFFLIFSQVPEMDSFKPEKNWNPKGHFLVNFKWVTMPKFILMSLIIWPPGHRPSQSFLLSQWKLLLFLKYGFLKKLIHYKCTSCQLTISSYQN